MKEETCNRLRIRHLDPARLKPWEDNPRVNDKAVESVARSIKRFGFNAPILCDEKLSIIAGHTRWRAAKDLGLSKVPVIVLPLQGTERKAYSIADHKTSQIAEWDFDGLEDILTELAQTETDLTDLGFSEDELAAILASQREVDWEDFEELLKSTSEKEFALYPVKVRLSDKKAIRERFDRLAEQHEIRHKDAAVVAGRILCLLLGIGG